MIGEDETSCSGQDETSRVESRQTRSSSVEESNSGEEEESIKSQIIMVQGKIRESNEANSDMEVVDTNVKETE